MSITKSAAEVSREADRVATIFKRDSGAAGKAAKDTMYRLFEQANEQIKKASDNGVKECRLFLDVPTADYHLITASVLTELAEKGYKVHVTPERALIDGSRI